MAGISINRFERNDLASVRRSLAHQRLDFIEQVAAEVRAMFARRNRYFKVNAFQLPIAQCRAQKQSEPRALLVSQPHRFSQASGGQGFSDVHFLVLQRADYNRIVLIRQEVGDGRSLVTEVVMQPQQLHVTPTGKHFLQRELDVHTSSYRKSATGSYQLLKLMIAKVLFEPALGQWYCRCRS